MSADIMTSRLQPSESQHAGSSKMSQPLAPKTDNYLTTEEAARVLRLSPKTLERFRLEGHGPPFFKLGPGKRARVLYKKDDLIAWIESRRFGSTSEYPPTR